MKIIIQRYADSTCAKERVGGATINLNKQGNFKIIKFALLILEFLFLFFIWALNF
jgi:hypothetical protein